MDIKFQCQIVNYSEGVPQGSIMGPITVNLFLNDIICVILDGQLYKYEDDNSVQIQAKQK